MQERIFAALRRGANAEALSLARVSVAEAPHDAHAYALLAHAERANGDQVAAQHAIARAVLLAPQDPNLHFQRAGFLLTEHRLGEAQAALARTLDLDPNQFPLETQKVPLTQAYFDLPASSGWMLIILPPSYINSTGWIAPSIPITNVVMA